MTEDRSPLVSKREGQRSLTIEEFMPSADHLYLTDDDEVEAVRQAALSGANVVLSPLLALEFVCDWRNMHAGRAQ